MRAIVILPVLAAMTGLLASCLSDAGDGPDSGTPIHDTIYVYDTTYVHDSVAVIDTTVVVSPYAKFVSGVTVTQDGSNIVIVSTGVPNHKSPYFAATDARYEAYNGTGTFVQNPNTIATQSLTFRIPANPAPATTHKNTSGGPIGVAINGVPLFNQYAAGNAALTDEIKGFDQYNGHPQMQGQYHYHVEPLYLTAQNGKSSLIGFLLDGYPVYGPSENGVTVLESSLDTYHGHTSVTAEYPNGIYHYHITAASP